MKIRTTMTFLWLMFGGTVGIFLFMLKYEVQALEDRLADLNSSIRSDQQSIHVLKAEWNHLNDPSRLRKLSMRHIELRSIHPSQLTSFSSLPFMETEPVTLSESLEVAKLLTDKPSVKVSSIPRPARKPVDMHMAKAEKTE